MLDIAGRAEADDVVGGPPRPAPRQRREPQPFHPPQDRGYLFEDRADDRVGRGGDGDVVDLVGARERCLGVTVVQRPAEGVTATAGNWSSAASASSASRLCRAVATRALAARVGSSS